MIFKLMILISLSANLARSALAVELMDDVIEEHEAEPHVLVPEGPRQKYIIVGGYMKILETMIQDMSLAWFYNDYGMLGVNYGSLSNCYDVKLLSTDPKKCPNVLNYLGVFFRNYLWGSFYTQIGLYFGTHTSRTDWNYGRFGINEDPVYETSVKERNSIQTKITIGHMWNWDFMHLGFEYLVFLYPIFEFEEQTRVGRSEVRPKYMPNGILFPIFIGVNI